jgi:hypothetical protein
MHDATASLLRAVTRLIERIQEPFQVGDPERLGLFQLAEVGEEIGSVKFEVCRRDFNGRKNAALEI